MPPGRPARSQSRIAQNENDENNTTRVTRAKAAALDPEPATKAAALQPKRSAASSHNVAPHRKRAALGDVSNVGKADVADGKKATNGKLGLVSKAAQPTGVQKAVAPARPAGRTTIVSKKAEVKRAATTTTTTTATTTATSSGPSTLVGSQKRKTSLREDVQGEDAGPAKKRALTVDAERHHRSESRGHLESRAASKVETKAEEPVVDSRITELDMEDLDDPLMAAEYAPEIFQYLYELEEKTKPNPEYMSHQDDLEWKTRGILVDWLIEVHTRFHLLPETLFLAVNIIDRFLSEKVVQLDRLQLVGITAMFIASKYEEVLSPHVENFKRIADDGFSEAEILSAERFVLSTLEYDLSYPNPMNFLRRVSKADSYDIQSRTVGKYLMEISLLDHRFMRYSSSHIAAAAMYLSRLILDRGEWNKTIAYYAGYTENELGEVVYLMVDYLARPVIHEAFFKKYASKKFLKASILARRWAKESHEVFGVADVELSLDQIS